jgi:hypothetical protein
VLLTLVIAYLLVTIAIGLYAAKRVKNSADFAIAGRKLPLAMIVTTTFATWFGSETVLGIPAKFVNSGLNGVVEDPFGAGTCLILVGIFFAGRLYRMNLMTISDYYRERFGRTVEVVCSLIIMLSYLGWVSAQVTALGLVFNVLSDGAISVPVGMVIGVVSILAYTLFGGMWSVAITDFIQMIILVAGLAILAVFAGNLAGGADKVVALAASKDLFKFWPEPSFKDMVFFFAAAITMMLGSIPQQDVFQRVMSANSESAATKGPVIGGVFYILFAFVPMFLVASALIIMPEQTAALLKEDPQKVLPHPRADTDALCHAGPFFRRAVVGHQVHRVSHVARAERDVRGEHLAPVPAAHGRSPGTADHAHHRSGVQCARSALCDPHAGNVHLRDGVGRLSGDAGGRIRAAGVWPVLEQGDDPRGDFFDRAGPFDLGPLSGNPSRRGVSGTAGGHSGGTLGHADRLARTPGNQEQPCGAPQAGRHQLNASSVQAWLGATGTVRDILGS